MIKVTENAVKHLRDLLEEKQASPADEGLRLGVSRGGCAGMQYTMQIGSAQESDTVIEAGDVRIFLDEESLPWLKDSHVDYVEALNDSGFRIVNPQASRTCGCGTSFEPTAEEAESTYDPAMDGTACGSDAT